MPVIHTIIAITVGSFGVFSGLHAMLSKRDPRSALGWLVLCVMLPGIGAAAYWLLGVNRIETRARRWQQRGRFDLARDPSYEKVVGGLEREHPDMAETLESLVKISERVAGRPLLRGNKVEPLHNGENAYAAMLEAIDSAERSVYLSTYLFDTDEAGKRFIAALGRAAERGVLVRVLVDAVGERYSRPRASRLLRKLPGVKVARFLPLALSPRGLRVNLRNHRKLLIVDGKLGFTGGMNIGQRHMVTDERNRKRTSDLHFRVTGPVVWALEEVFFEDWLFTTGEEPKTWDEEHRPEPTAKALCRAISDGPNEDIDRLHWIIVGALSCARQKIQIMTPYFVPNRELLAALNAAALRGVEVDILLPKKNNLPYVAWASQALLWEVLRYGVRVYYQPPPFDHSKLLVVDEFYVMLGSANLDPRSLRLNFEFNLEVYDFELGKQLSEHFEALRQRAQAVTLEDVDSRSLPVKLRDSFCKLFAPYL